MSKEVKLTDKTGPDTMTIGQLWNELALFCNRRNNDNYRYDGDYPIDTREIQMPALHSLVSAIEKFHIRFGKAPLVSNVQPKQPTEFRIYKVKSSRIRKDGSKLVKTYGCDGRNHYIKYDRIWFDGPNGEATSGRADVKPLKFIGKCGNGRKCKNYGFFTEFMDGHLGNYLGKL
jgi:hypothetical protein